MRHFVLLAAAAVLFTSCHESEPTTEVTDTRRLTIYDQERLGNIVDLPPLGWRSIPPTRFRSINFVAGPDDSVEIFLGNSSGSALENANRWLRQFGLTPVANEESFDTVNILGRDSVLVEAEGTYNPGMGAQGGENYALVGAIRVSSAELMTIKMVGPAEAVAELKDEFVKYCETLRQIEGPVIKKESEKTPQTSETE